MESLIWYWSQKIKIKKHLYLNLRKDSKNLKKTAKSALKQIDDENYSEGLKYEGYKEIVKIGMGFRKKDVEVVVEEEWY